MNKANPWLILLSAAALTACGGADTTNSNVPEPAATEPGDSAAVASAAHPGESIYQNYCFSCHNPGLSGAPKLGDAEAWGPRIAKGPVLLLQTTIEGIQPAMPPRGMCFDCSDEDLAAAVDYMIIESQ